MPEVQLLGLTQASCSPAVDAGTGNENIVNNSENAFATDKSTTLLLDFAVEKRGGLV